MGVKGILLPTLSFSLPPSPPCLTHLRRCTTLGPALNPHQQDANGPAPLSRGKRQRRPSERVATASPRAIAERVGGAPSFFSFFSFVPLLIQTFFFSVKLPLPARVKMQRPRRYR